MLIHFARHMEDIALAALPREVDDETEQESDGSSLHSSGTLPPSTQEKEETRGQEARTDNFGTIGGEQAKAQAEETYGEQLKKAIEELRREQPEMPSESLREIVRERLESERSQRVSRVRVLWDRGSTQAGSTSINATHPLMINSEFAICRCKIHELKGNDWHDHGTGFVKVVESGSARWDIVVWSEDEAESRRLLWAPISRDDGFQRQQDTLIVWATRAGIDMAMSFQDSEGCSVIWQVIKDIIGPAEDGDPNDPVPLSRQAADRLRAWLEAHANDPYPSASQTSMLARECGITEKQVDSELSEMRAVVPLRLPYDTVESQDTYPTRAGRISKAKKGLKVHNCECGRSYTRAEHLRRHQKNHTKIFLTCPECGKPFYRQDLLDRHIARHGDEASAGSSAEGITLNPPAVTSTASMLPPDPLLSQDKIGAWRDPSTSSFAGNSEAIEIRNGTPDEFKQVEQPSYLTQKRKGRGAGNDRSRDVRRPTKIPLHALMHLRGWLRAHQDNPYPSPDDKRALAQKCSITERQVTTWFTNARARNISYGHLEEEGHSEKEGYSEEEGHSASDVSSMANTPMIMSAAVNKSTPSREVANFGYAGDLFRSFAGASPSVSPSTHTEEDLSPFGIGYAAIGGIEIPPPHSHPPQPYQTRSDHHTDVVVPQYTQAQVDHYYAQYKCYPPLPYQVKSEVMNSEKQDTSKTGGETQHSSASFQSAQNHQQSSDIKSRLTKEQHEVLEQHFMAQNKPSAIVKKGIASDIGVPLDKINVSSSGLRLFYAAGNMLTR